ncbi:MAG: DsbA family protein [Candidatus Ancillula trichonymphae]|nr:DsbA family protein [Candidatus Ancillula trichonymphae]
MISIGVVFTTCLIVVVVVFSNSSGKDAGTSSEKSKTPSVASKHKPRADYADQLSPSSPIWNQSMLVGDPAAKNHFIEYTDMFCPYCAKFNLALHGSQADFEQNFITPKKMNLEIRLVSMLTDHENSDKGGAHAYCAARQNRFHKYYSAMIQKVNEQYFSKGIGAYHEAPDIPILPDSFFQDEYAKAGLDKQKMTECMQKGEGLSDLGIATATAQKKLPSGLPHFVFNTFTTSGFDGDYSRIKVMLKAGGVS